MLHLLLLPENRNLLGYLSWMLWNGGHSITACEPEAATVFVSEKEPATIRSKKSMRAAQSILEPRADLCLIDLWSAHPDPSQVLHLPRQVWMLRSRPEFFLLQSSCPTAWSYPHCWLCPAPDYT